MKVSVIVLVYNQEVYLREALDSLTAQTLKEVEFIIINDGSTDDSISIIRQYAEADDRFVVVDKENGGVASAINIGNKMARGEYLAEMDSDDYVAPNKYEKMYEIAKANDLDILKCNLVNFTGSGTTYIGQTEKIARPGYYHRVLNPRDDQAIITFPMYAWVALYRRTLIIDNDIMWNDGVSSYNDNGFYWQTMSLAQRVMYLDEDLIYHRRDNEMSTVKNPDKMFRNFFIEHAFIKAKLKERGSFEDLKRFFFERKIQNYRFALNIIPYEKKQEFFRLISEDFRIDMAEDGLNDVEFTNPRNMKIIREIVSDPYRYYFMEYLPNTYKVSVIVPIHNAEKFLRNTLDRLVNQTLREVEFILVENGSTDQTVEIMREYKNRDPRIATVSIGVSNAGNARNVGLSMAHGQYVIFLDADDEYDLRLLEKTYAAAVKDKADVVWFNSQEKNALNGLIKPHPHAFGKKNFPSTRPFRFRDISGNPFDSFIGWPWDKLYSMQHIRAHSLSYQSLEVSNDGYFNFLAMSKAERITTLDEVLVTRIVGHGNNISANRHDLNPDNQLNMILAIHEKLKLIRDEGKTARAFAERSIRSIAWLFSSGFKTREGVEKYFDLLVSGAIDKIELETLQKSEIAANRRELHKKLLAMRSYKPGDYDKFIAEVGGADFEMAQGRVLASYPVNTKTQDRTGRLIFGQSNTLGAGRFRPWINIIIGDHPTSNVTAVIDFVYMGHFKAAVRDTLSLSIALHQQPDGTLAPVVHQAEWETGQRELLEGIFYSFVGNVLTIHAKHSGQFTGFDYRLRNISSREGKITFSVSNVAAGYNQGLLYDNVPAITPIRSIRLLLGNTGSRTVFRAPSDPGTGQDLLVFELTAYQYNNMVMALEIMRAPNNLPAVHDTLYLGFSLRESDGELCASVFQAEWLHGRRGLKDRIYYYLKDGRLYLGARYDGQWGGYSVKVSHVMGREIGRDYSIHKIAPELVEHGLPQIPAEAEFINAIMAD